MLELRTNIKHFFLGHSESLVHIICNIWHLAEPRALIVMTISKWHVQHYEDREKSKKSRKNQNFQIIRVLLEILIATACDDT